MATPDIHPAVEAVAADIASMETRGAATIADATAQALVRQARESVIAGATEFRERLDTAQSDLGAIGANRLRDGETIMTHCHLTDALACVETACEQGTSLSAIITERGQFPPERVVTLMRELFGERIERPREAT